MRKAVIVLFLGAGFLAIILAVLADLIGFGGQAGLGAKQIAMILSGVLSISLGIFVWRVGLKDELFRSGHGAEDSLSWVGTLLVAAWFGALTGTIDTSIQAYKKFFLGEILYLSHHFLWQIPLGTITFFVITAIGFILLGLVWKGAKQNKIRYSFILFLSVSNLALLINNVHAIALLILSLGIALQLSKIAVRYDKFIQWLTRNTAVMFGLLVLSTMVGMLVMNP